MNIELTQEELRLVIDAVHRENMRHTFLLNGGRRDDSLPYDRDRLDPVALAICHVESQMIAGIQDRLLLESARPAPVERTGGYYDTWCHTTFENPALNGWYVYEEIGDADTRTEDCHHKPMQQHYHDPIAGPFDTEYEAATWRP